MRSISVPLAAVLLALAAAGSGDRSSLPPPRPTDGQMVNQGDLLFTVSGSLPPP